MNEIELPPVAVGEQIYTARIENGKNMLPPRGSRTASLMLIMSHPNQDDLSNNRILSGEYREEVEAAVIAAGLTFDDIYVTSMVKCGIGSKSKPSPELIAHHAPILDYEIEQLKPKLIMTMGAEVFKRIMKANKKQGDSLGEIIDSPYGKLLPNYSPGMILHQDPKQRGSFRDAFEYAWRYLNNKLDYTPFTYVVLNDVAAAKAVVEDYISKEMFDIGYDAEWKGKKLIDDEVMYTFQFSCEPDVAVILNISDDGINENRELLNTVKPLIEHLKARRMGWNIRGDDKRLQHRGFTIPDETLAFDGMKACAFIDSRYAKGLETGINKFTNYERYYAEFDKVRESLKIARHDLADVKLQNPEAFYKYCAGDAVSHRTACLNMKALMEKLPKQVKDYYYQTYLPLSAYFLDLEMTGIPMDLTVMEDLTTKYTTKYRELFDELQELTRPLGFDSQALQAADEALFETNPELDADERSERLKLSGVYEDFNPASAPQKKILLYQILGMEPPYYTKAGKSPKPRAWYVNAKQNVRSQYSPSTNGKSLATLKFELAETIEEMTKNPGDFTEAMKVDIQRKSAIIEKLLSLNRVSVFATKFLNKQGTGYDVVEEEDEDDGEEGLKSSYWNALCSDNRIHADFFECLKNFRSSSKVNVQNPASKVLSHIPNIFVPGYSSMTKEEQKANASKIPVNIRQIFWSGDKDWHWAEIDVASADLAIAALLSRDQAYIKDVRSGSFHLIKAREYFQDPKITKDDYSKYVSAKSISFRVAYTNSLLSAALPIQAEIYAESGIWIDKKTVEFALGTWKRYEKYMEYREHCSTQVSEDKRIVNARGIPFYFDTTENNSIKASWENESLAYPIASELALFVWDVSVNIKKELKRHGAWMKWVKPLSCVHDALYFGIHKDLMKDNYFPELCRYFFTDYCKIATGDTLGMDMIVGDRWKANKENIVFAKETKWDFDKSCWVWK